MAKLNLVVGFVLRAAAAIAAMAAAVKMAIAHDSAQFLTLKFEAKYSSSPSFKYFVIVNSVVTCYSVIVLLILPYRASLLWRLLLLIDTFVTFMMTSSLSAAMAIAYVGKKGNSHAGWLPICGQVPKFCNAATGAVISGFIATLLYFLLLIYSMYWALAPLFSFKE